MLSYLHSHTDPYRPYSPRCCPSDRAKQVQLSQLSTQCCQAGTTGKMLRRFCGRFVHDGPPIVRLTFFNNRYGPSSCSWQVSFWGHLATILDKI
jgi:hypothetical protein